MTQFNSLIAHAYLEIDKPAGSLVVVIDIVPTVLLSLAEVSIGL